MALEVTTTTFEQEVIQSDKPVLVDFWAEWCGPCHAVSPVLDRIAEEREDELKLVKVNIDEEQGLRALRHRVDPDDDPLQGRRAVRGRDRRAAEGRDRALPRSRRRLALPPTPPPARSPAPAGFASVRGCAVPSQRHAFLAARAVSLVRRSAPRFERIRDGRVNASSSGPGSSSGANHRSSATSSAATGSPTSVDAHHPVEVQGRRGVGRLAVDVHPGAEEASRLAREAGFLARPRGGGRRAGARPPRGSRRPGPRGPCRARPPGGRGARGRRRPRRARTRTARSSRSRSSRRPGTRLAQPSFSSAVAQRGQVRQPWRIAMALPYCA